MCGLDRRRSPASHHQYTLFTTKNKKTQNKQAEACLGSHQWVNYWLHAGHLHIKGACGLYHTIYVIERRSIDGARNEWGSIRRSAGASTIRPPSIHALHQRTSPNLKSHPIIFNAIYCRLQDVQVPQELHHHPRGKNHLLLYYYYYINIYICKYIYSWHTHTSAPTKQRKTTNTTPKKHRR